jgi:hypothetical protein
MISMKCPSLRSTRWHGTALAFIDPAQFENDSRIVNFRDISDYWADTPGSALKTIQPSLPLLPTTPTR